MTEEIVDDFDKYSEKVQFPEGAPDEKIKEWFREIFSGWKDIPGDFTTNGLEKAIRLLGERGWQFRLTVLKEDIPEGVPFKQIEGENGWQMEVLGRGQTKHHGQLRIGLSQGYLALSKHMGGLIKAFSNREVLNLSCFLPETPPPSSM